MQSLRPLADTVDHGPRLILVHAPPAPRRILSFKGANKEVRVSVLGHIQRGGSPSPYDGVLATRFGVAAVELISRGEFGKMVALRAGSIVAVDVAEAIGHLKSVHPQGELVCTARAIGIGFGN